MAERLKVSTEEMISTVNTFNTQKSAQMTAYENMKSTVAGLAGAWLGEASQTFQSQFQNFYTNIAQSEARMEDAVNEMEKAVNLFGDAEQAGIGKAEALGVGRSPFS